MPNIDEKVEVTRDETWQYVRIPLSVDLPQGELHLRQNGAGDPLTLSPVASERTKEERLEALRRFFAAVDAAHAVGETFELDRQFCPPRDVEI